MALTAEVLFVNPDYIKRLTQVNGGVEDSVMVPAIILAQDKHLQNYLGTDLLEKLKSDIAGAGPTGDYATLLDDYVRKATVWWSMVEMIPNLYVKLDNGGLVIRVSDDRRRHAHTVGVRNDGGLSAFYNSDAGVGRTQVYTYHL